MIPRVKVVPFLVLATGDNHLVAVKHRLGGGHPSCRAAGLDPKALVEAEDHLGTEERPFSVADLPRASRSSPGICTVRRCGSTVAVRFLIAAGFGLGHSEKSFHQSEA